MKNRISILNSIIKKVIAPLILKRHQNDIFGLITVNRVETAKNFDSCKVFVTSTLNQDKLVPMLNKNVHRIQTELNHTIRSRKVPKIIFRFDQNALEEVRILKLLDNL